MKGRGFTLLELLVVLVVLALVGFIGSVTIARFAAAESDDDRRILTREEAREALARERAELDAEADPDASGAEPTANPSAVGER